LETGLVLIVFLLHTKLLSFGIYTQYQCGSNCNPSGTSLGA